MPSPLFLLAATAVAYGLAQIVLVGWHRGLEWDEAVYASQVSRFAVAAEFEVHRARGITVVALPVELLTPSVTVLRLYLVGVSSLALFAAFRPWVRAVPGYAAPLAAAIFGVLWPALFFGSELTPNLYVAFAAVAALGYLGAAVRRARGRNVLGYAASLGVVAVMRPADAGWLAVAILPMLLALPSRRRLLVAGAAGLAAGALPWVVETLVRFGSPTMWWPEAEHLAGSAWSPASFTGQLSLLHGALICCSASDRATGLPLPGAASWVTLALFALTGGGFAFRRVERTPVVGAALAGAALAGQYLLLTHFVYARFLLPAYALLAVPAAYGLLRLLALARRARGGGPVLAGVVGALLGLAAWNLAIAHTVGAHEQRGRQVVPQLAAAARSVGVRPPCRALGVHSAQIAFSLHCYTGGADRDTYIEDPVPAQRWRADGEQVVVFWRGPLPASSFVRLWGRVPLRSVDQRGWVLYLPSRE